MSWVQHIVCDAFLPVNKKTSGIRLLCAVALLLSAHGAQAVTCSIPSECNSNCGTEGERPSTGASAKPNICYHCWSENGSCDSGDHQDNGVFWSNCCNEHQCTCSGCRQDMPCGDELRPNYDCGNLFITNIGTRFVKYCCCNSKNQQCASRTDCPTPVPTPPATTRRRRSTPATGTTTTPTPPTPTPPTPTPPTPTLPTPTPPASPRLLEQSFQDTTISAGSYIGAVKEVYECAYARTLRSTFCEPNQANTPPVVYAPDVKVTSTASRRSAIIRMSITFPSSTSITNFNAANMVAQMNQVNVATGNRVFIPSPGGISTVGSGACADDDQQAIRIANVLFGVTITGCAEVGNLCNHALNGADVQKICCKTCANAGACTDDNNLAIKIANSPGVSAAIRSVGGDPSSYSSCAEASDYCNDANYGATVRAACCATCAGSESGTPWVLIGIIAGGVVGLGLIGIGIYCYCRGRKATKEEPPAVSQDDPPPFEDAQHAVPEEGITVGIEENLEGKASFI